MSRDMTVAGVLERRRKTQRIILICVTVLKSFLHVAALLMLGALMFFSATEKSLLTLFGMFLIYFSVLFTMVGTVLSFVALVINVAAAGFFSKWWNWITLAGILVAVLFFILYTLIESENVIYLFFVWVVLACVPSGFEFAAFLRYQGQKKSSKKER